MASFALLSVLLALITVFHTDANTPGSTPYLRDIIVGRCEDYFRQNTKIKPKNCTEIWKKFHDVFAFKDACSLTPADYEPFFDVMEEGDILNKAMFWSGTYKTAHSYSFFDLKFTTLEDTLAGSMMNDLRWCGNPSLPRSSDGVDYQSCPDCLTYNKFFWIQASKRFAERVTGQARVMVNGTRTTGPAYNSTGSIFGKYELPNLKVPKITKLFIIVIHTIGKEPIEKCGTKSIKQLEKDAKKRNLMVICKNDPDMSKHVLCIDHPEANECRFAEEDPGKQYWRTLAIVFAVLFVVMLVILIIVLVLLYFCRKKRSSASSP